MDRFPDDKAKPDLSFKKDERLCSKKVIEKLFSDGSSFLVHPVKVVYLPIDFQPGVPVKVAFTASKKIFRKAVHRNLIKRRMREAFRLNKAIFHEENLKINFAVFFIFIGKEIADFKTVEFALKRALKRIVKEINQKNEN
jgi:ribonuclease P protein component